MDKAHFYLEKWIFHDFYALIEFLKIRVMNILYRVQKYTLNKLKTIIPWYLNQRIIDRLR